MEKLRAAVIGLGKMGAQPSSRFGDTVPVKWLPVSHAEAIQAVEQLQLVAGCDQNEENRNKYKTLYNMPYTYSDYEKLIDEIKPEFVSIATRTEGRAEIIKYASENGAKMIYFEKPVSRSIEECRMALAALRQNNVIVAYGVTRRYHATFRQAKEMLKSGEFGSLVEIIVEHGKTNLLWSHPHSTDIILYFADTTELEYMQGTCSFQNGYEPDDTMFIDDDPIIDNAYFLFKNGIKATINQTGGANIRLACTEGIITICSNGRYIETRKGGGKFFTDINIIPESVEYSPATVACKELVDIYTTQIGTPVITLEEIETGLMMLFGVVYSSVKGGRRISVTDIPSQMVVTGRSGVLYA